MKMKELDRVIHGIQIVLFFIGIMIYGYGFGLVLINDLFTLDSLLGITLGLIGTFVILLSGGI